MSQNDINTIISNYDVLKNKFYRTTSLKSIVKIPSPKDIDDIRTGFYNLNSTKMTYEYAWRIATAYLN